MRAVAEKIHGFSAACLFQGFLEEVKPTLEVLSSQGKSLMSSMGATGVSAVFESEGGPEQCQTLKVSVPVRPYPAFEDRAKQRIGPNPAVEEVDDVAYKLLIDNIPPDVVHLQLPTPKHQAPVLRKSPAVEMTNAHTGS